MKSCRGTGLNLTLDIKNPKKQKVRKWNQQRKQEIESFIQGVRVSMNRTITILGVAIISTVYIMGKGLTPSGKNSLRKQLCEQMKGAILEINCKEVLLMGIPRVKALLKRDYGLNVTKVMVQYRLIWKKEGLLISRHRNQKEQPGHTPVK